MFDFTRILKFNPAHHPAGSSIGGQFAPKQSAGPTVTGMLPFRGKATAGVLTVERERRSIETTPEGAKWIAAHRRQGGMEGLPGGKTNPIPCGGDLEKAQRLVGMGKHITLDQPDQLATLVQKIHADVTRAKSTGTALPVFNIAGISIRGTNLFAQDNLDIDRVYMPQVGGIPIPGSRADALPKDSRGGVDLTDEFLASMASEGIGAKEEVRLASHLRATQDGIDGGKVASIAQDMQNGTLEEGVITVTRDGYVLDGHHRWAATIVNDLIDNHPGDLTIRVKVLDIDIGTALSKAREFQEQWGIPSKKVGQKREWAVGRTATTFKERTVKAEVKKKKRKRIQGMQDVPMDCDAIDASMKHANS